MTVARHASWLLVAVALQAAPARAQQRSLPQLSWQAPVGCPQAEGMRERLRSLAGPAKARSGSLRAEGEITRLEDGRFQLRLVLRDGELVGERIIASKACEDLAGAAAVTLSLLMSSESPLTEDQLRGENATSGTTSSRSEPAAPKPSPAPEQPVPVPAPAPASAVAPTARGWHLLLRLPAAALELGPLPKASLGLGLGLGARYGAWRLLAAGTLWKNQSIERREQPGQGADVGRLSAALAVGRGFRVERFVMTPFAVGTLEHVRARGTGAGVTPRESSASFISAGLGLNGSLPLGDVAALVVEVSGRVQTARPVIAIEGLGDVRQLGAVALTSTLAAEWTF
jgi:hypothetical protein